MVNPQYCKYLCSDVRYKEQFIRLWSNTTQWPANILPAEGSNVTIPGEWTIRLDVDPNPLTQLIIEGTMLVDDRDTVMMVGFMLVKGNFVAGEISRPRSSALTIYVNGSKASPSYSYGEGLSANKAIIVTGNMSLYSNYEAWMYQRLISKVTANSSASFTVYDGNLVTGWTAGD